MSSAEMEKTDLVGVTIDGVQVSVPKDTLVIRAAEQIGVQIPRFCDHPLLAPAGACRQCLVEVPDAGNGRGFPKPQASCTLPVAEGMVVSTQVTSQVADKAQQGVMELLLINHPLDCPVCDQGGECPLQNQAMSNGRGESRFSDGRNQGVKRTFPKPINLSPIVLLDRERCIVCQRCTRFADEIAGDTFIELLERGADQQIGISLSASADASGFTSYFSGNVIQICPVGALTSEQYRFRSRPFDLVSSPGIAEHDACGSAIRIDHRRGKVMRRQSGNDARVNEEWITDKDRFAYAYATAADRLTYPQIREDDGSLRPASWPEAFAVAARGLTAHTTAGGGRGVGVLTGGRVTAEDAYAYSKFARLSLGTNDIDFRARPHSVEEADFLASSVVTTGPASGAVTFGDLESATKVVLVGHEPEDEAGTIFLRLRKSVRAGGTEVIAIAPFTTPSLKKLSGRLVPTAPGEEASALEALSSELDDTSVLLVGDRLATVPGALATAAALAASSGARLAWVPRRAGDRGALEAGCLPTLLPGGRPVAVAAARVDLAAAWGTDALPETPGRDGDAIVAALTEGQLGGLVIAGVDPDDTSDPAATRAAIAAAEFVVAFELRATEVTDHADVIFPVAPTTDKDGSYLNWEGRVRTWEAALHNPASLPELRALSGIAEEMTRLGQGSPLGFRTILEARAEMRQVGPWDGERPATATTVSEAADQPSRDPDTLALSTWKQLIDNGALQDGDKYLQATARTPVALISAPLYDQYGPTVTLTGDRGEVTLAAAIAEDLVDGVVWMPANSVGNGVLADLASPGSAVTISGAEGVHG
ncbi:MAG: NADH-quinone oxidoreductase subunit G [Nocardioidaceae bacterium]|nr:NADH-quinone oxidoreductase subunit G [Nocardioidaceae bacterium]